MEHLTSPQLTLEQMKIATIEVKLNVYLTTDLDDDADDKQIKQIVDDVLNGNLNQLIDNVELIEFETQPN